jgi:hypothetical protein
MSRLIEVSVGRQGICNGSDNHDYKAYRVAKRPRFIRTFKEEVHGPFV